ncbi:MAG: putative dipeptidase PepE [Chloroflexi bacterium]|nr:putative dipeptidase PepE [Chloroflexota bacterium]
MKNDLDQLMQANNLDSLLFTGPAQHNSPMYYMTGGGHMTGADLVKKRDEEPVLFYRPMERDAAAATGLKAKNLAEYEYKKLLKSVDGDHIQATALRYQKMLHDVGLTKGRMALYGKMDAGSAWGVFSALQALMPELTLVGEGPNSVLLEARATKDEKEVERIRHMGEVTVEVVERVAGYLTSRAVNAKEVLLREDGQPLTIGDVKSKINLWLAEAGVENPEGVIFASGRNAGVPHNSGEAKNLLRLGQTIVFDIFPCEAGGGYFYDFTRTWCLGYAPDDVQALYDDVYAVYEQIVSELEVNAHAPDLQKRTCELFEERGHKTIRQDSKLQSGYVHSLGHGLGVDIHERPRFGHGATEADKLAPGTVTTIEPGLYYPERGMGCRLENTFWVSPEGKIELLAQYPLDLVLKMK